jgi:predicted dehydrogenase
MKKYGILLVSGKGTHQSGHAVEFLNDNRCKLIAVTDDINIDNRRKKLNIELADELNIPYIDHIEKALERKDVDIVSVCCEVERRAKIIPLCAQYKKDLYLDKPLGKSEEDINIIADAVNKSGVVVSVQLSRVESHWVQQAKTAIQSGNLGDIRSIHVDELFAKGKAGTILPGVIRQEKSNIKRYTFVEAKAELFDIGWYPIGIASWLMRSNIRKVLALTGNYFFSHHVKCGVEDFGALMFQFDNGVTGSVVAGRYGSMSHPDGGRRRITIIGSKGAETFDPMSPRIEVYNTDPYFIAPEENPSDPMGMFGGGVPKHDKNRWVSLVDEFSFSDVSKFIDCIEKDIKPSIGIEEAKHYSKVILGAYNSAESGNWIAIKD